MISPKEPGASQTLIAADATSRWIYRRFRELDPPLIVIGMHRSGTSLIAAMLALMGVYMGRIGDPQEESKLIVHHTSHSTILIYATYKVADILPTPKRAREGYGEDESFRLVNERLLARAGASWNYVDPFLTQRNDPAFTQSAVRILQRATFGILRTQYLSGMPKGYTGPWGWKDPRNSLTLPYWLHLFPEAKVLHVRRNTDAVVKSLMRRAESWALADAKQTPPPLHRRVIGALSHPRWTVERLLWGKQPQKLPQPKTEEEWRRLCEQYVHECEQWRVLGDHYLEVNYEALLENPKEIALALANFANTEVNTAVLDQVEKLVIPPDTKRW